ncbi:MAG: RidA family protein [Caulobacter sp.]|nr:RidA family protein [Caulobacter sp.]
MRLPFAVLAAFAVAAPALAQTAPAYPVKIPAPGGEVIIPSAGHQKAYDEYRYAPARRVGDMVYVSGVVTGRMPGEGKDAAAFEAQIRRAFVHLDRVLKASGSSFDEVAMVNSFHVWEGEDVGVTRFEQLDIINRVKADYIKGAQPAWTAVGTTGLLAPGGIVEIQVIARVTPRG